MERGTIMENLKRITIMSMILLSFLPLAALGAPPRVIKTVPENGAQDVDPKLKQIRVVFDQDMTSGRNFSICGGGSKFPKIIGSPQWINKRTIVMRVRLVSNHKYQFSINCPSAKNFRSVQGEAAEVYPIGFRTGPGVGRRKAERHTIADNTDAVKELRRAINENYSYRDIRQVDWDKLFEEKTDELRRAKTPEKFATIAGELLANAKDKHIWLYVGEQRFGSYVNPVMPNANFSKLKELVPKWRKRSAVVFTGQFEDGIGYILIDSWARNHSEALEQTYEAIWEFTDAPGLIIDVRGNGGGAEPLAQQFAGCFINEPKIYAQHVYRAVDEPGGFTKPHNRILEPNKHRPRYRGKIAVLTGPVIMSSCEAFLLMMKQVPNCKLVGGKSQGSSGNPKPVNLGNGVTVFLPSWKAMRPDGTCFEAEGISPDIPVETTQTALVSRDPVIEAALKLLRKP